MRIAIVTSSFPADARDSSNAGVFVRDFAALLGEDGHEVTVFTPQRAVVGPDDPFRVHSFWWPGRETSLTHVDAKTFANKLRLGALLVSGLFGSLRRVRRRDFDHVLAMWAVPSGLFALAVRRVRGVPYSVWALGSDIWRIDDYPMGRRLLRRVLRGAAHCYADGVGLARDTVACGAPQCDFLATSRRLQQVPDVAAPDDGRVHALCVARFHPHKGVDVLVEAVGKLPTAARARLVVDLYGGGPDEAAIDARIAQLGLTDVVLRHGFVDRDGLATALARSDVAVIPSRVESIPLVLSDIAQIGTPMIVTDTGDVGELVREYDTGVVVPPGDADALAGALERAIVDGPIGDRGASAKLADALDLANSVRQFVGAASVGDRDA